MSRLTWNPEAVKSAIVASCNDGLKAVGAVVQGEMSRILGVRHGGIPSKPGQPPNSQSGRLRNSVLVDQARPLEVRIGTNLAYGSMLEFGGTILPHGKRLAIPLSKDAKRACAMGQRPRSIILAAKFDKSRPLRYIPTKGGDTIIIRDWKRTALGRSGGGKIKGTNVAKGGKWSKRQINDEKKGEPFFLLARAVKIDARPWMRPAFQKSKPLLLGEFVKRANQSFRQRAKGATA